MTPSKLNTDDSLHAYARLRKAMAPDPSRWYYTGKCIDTGAYGESHCACGHEIRYEFIIECEDDGRTLVIGSTCIEKNVPSLLEHGYKRLATELDEARLKLQRDLARERRDLQAEEELSDLYTDFRQLRKWCFRRRDEWPQMYPDQSRPKVLHWIEEEPKTVGSPAEDAKKVRRCYVNMWVDAAQAVSAYWSPPPSAPPIPRQVRLFEQLSKRVSRALANTQDHNHEGAILAVELCPDFSGLRTDEKPTYDYPSRLLPDTRATAMPILESVEPEIFAEISRAAAHIWPEQQVHDRECPPWTVGADRELTDWMVKDRDTALVRLRGLDVPSGANRELADILERTKMMERVHGVHIADISGDRAIVFYFPFYENQRMGQLAGDAEIPWRDRWQDIASILSAVAAVSALFVSIGFVYENRTFSYSWYEYRSIYTDPPEFIAVLLSEES